MSCIKEVGIFIPVYNGGSLWQKCVSNLLDCIERTVATGLYKFKVLVVDSSSSDNTVHIAKNAGFDVLVIDKADFNHGSTRNLGLEYFSNSELVFYLTQDAFLASSSSLHSIVSQFSLDSSIGAVCGRQIPHDDANPLAIHARLFNYPSGSNVKSLSDVDTFGIKSVFMSNSFAAYRRTALEAVGGFPSNTILCEDMYVAAKMLQHGYKVAYCANAVVKHSHNYTAMEEFKRYFDIGVFHAMEPWIQAEFGGAGSEGMKYLNSEFKYLWHHHKSWLLKSFVNNAAKIIGIKFGKKYKALPLWFIRLCSMHYRYWR